MRARGAAVLGLLLLAFPAEAQTILNTERFQLAQVTGLHVGGDVSFNLQEGNTRILDVSASGMAGVLEGRHWTRLIFGGRYLSDEEHSLLDQQFAQVRHSYIFHPRVRTFHFVQAQKNETLLLRSRWLLGSGIRGTLLQTERTSVAVGTGLMGEWERLDGERVGPDDRVRLRALRMANLGVASVEFAGGGRLLNILYVQPDVADLGDLRVLNDLGFLMPITHWVHATISLEWRRDTRPPSSLKRDDLTLRMGFGVELN